MKKQYNAAKPADDPLAPYIETLYGGNAVRGIPEDESDTSITIRNNDGETGHVIDKDRITERINSPSGMPAIGNLLSRSELRDLVE